MPGSIGVRRDAERYLGGPRLCWSIEEAMLPQRLLGLRLVGWGWSVVVCAGGFGVGGLRGSVVGCAFGFGVGGLGLVGRGLCCKVWGWLVGVGQW